MKKLITLTLFSTLAVGSYAFAQGPARPFFDKLDTNHDGKLTKAEAQADANAKFAEIDTNHDGKASKDELKAHHAAMRAEHGGHWGRHGDEGKDGKPDDAQRKEMREKMGEHFFTKLDANSDGVLDQKEFTGGLLTRFDRMDANHDGVVVADEMRDGFHRGGHCGGHGPKGEHGGRGGHDDQGQAGSGADERG